ncbi:hypothetical protein NA57DRAFT_76698 [Rhizodiscina lignyota]|uniref:Uncharacterized protein n=1 Tax=Rhizodiscina lignyota TaxID=1504668 RepID=A0A9P4IDY1_9PEZI|nr:hypothetical protein NA57DRAFT_76698 [Rhizodiscina lignyota]
MEAIVQAILNKSKLEVPHIKITEPSQKLVTQPAGPAKCNAATDPFCPSRNFVMEIQSRVIGTGPVGATMTPMTVDLVGPGGSFGKLDLPEVKTSTKRADVHVVPQKIAITDFDAFLAFVRSITQDEQLTLMLDNGKGKIKALGMNANITYRKSILLPGMNGPKARIVKVEGSKDECKILLQVFNPSPLEIDLGTAIYEIQAPDGTKMAEVRGGQHVIRGDNVHELSCSVTGAPQAGAAKLVGIGAAEDSWTNESNKFLNMDVRVPPEMAAL